MSEPIKQTPTPSKVPAIKLGDLVIGKDSKGELSFGPVVTIDEANHSFVLGHYTPNTNTVPFTKAIRVEDLFKADSK